MDTKVNYSIVGLFVIALLASIVLCVIWLSSGLNTKTYSTYVIYMSESVNGLSTDSRVKFNGVDVGHIRQIRLNPKNAQQVELLVDIEEGIPLTTSTRAILSTQGLTGVSFIDLQEPFPDGTPLVRKPGEPYPIIATSPSLFFRLDKNLTELATNLNKVSIAMQSFLDQENRQAFKQVLNNLSRITKTLADNSKRFDTILTNTANASEKFPGLIQDGQSAIKTLTTHTIPQANDVLSNVQIITNNLLETSRSIKQNPSILIRGQTPQAPGPGEK